MYLFILVAYLIVSVCYAKKNHMGSVSSPAILIGFTILALFLKLLGA